MPICGVIFDFGGVIHNMRWDVAHALEQEHGLERNTVVRTLYDSDEWRAVQVGRGDVQAWREAAQQRLEAAAGRTLPPLHEQWHETWGLISENVELVRALRPPYRLAVLSNADITLEDRIRNDYGIYDLFDEVICSADVGLAKPDAAAYRLAAERLGLEAEECVFIDDTKPNVAGAQEVGMAAIHCRVERGDDLAAQLAELDVRPAAS